MEKILGFVRTKKILISILIIVLLTIIIFVLTPTKKVETIPKYIEVTAHRGLSEYYPENTIEAFKMAHEAGADWIELDVQETKDLVVVVTHDSNFKRLAGVNKRIWNLTYKEVRSLNVGAYMQKEATIPTLEEVIVWAKRSNIKLNIELKDNNHQKNLIKSVVDLINKYDYKSNVIVASQNYDFLSEVKKYDNTIVTAYVGRVLEYEISYYINADIFSIKKTDLTKELVKEMHDNNKKVYAWTILNEDEVLQMYEYDVDNLIANDVTLIKDILKKHQSNK